MPKGLDSRRPKAETVSHYGYGPGRIQWDRRIGIEEYGDRINYRICPECKGRQ